MQSFRLVPLDIISHVDTNSDARMALEAQGLGLVVQGLLKDRNMLQSLGS